MTQKILVVDDEPDIRNLLKDILEDEDYNVALAEDGQSARDAYDSFKPDLILLDIWMPDVDGISLLKEWKINEESHTSVVMMSGHGTVETAMEATKYGAQDFLEKPISMAKLLSTVKNNIKLDEDEIVVGKTKLKFEQLIGSSDMIKSLRKKVEEVAKEGLPLFVVGDNGVGKHVVASHLAYCTNGIEKIEWVMPRNFYLPSAHDTNCLYFVVDFADLSNHQIKQLANCFMENKLSNSNKNIRFVLASRYEYEYFSEKLLAYPLLGECWQDALRVPLLNEHKEDIPELLEYYANWISDTEELPYRHFNVATQNKLRNHDWRGNLSELKVLIRKLLTSNNELDIELQEIDALLQVIERRANHVGVVTEKMFPINLNQDLKSSRDAFEKKYLELQLEESKGNMSELARRSGQERTYLYRKIKALGIQTKK